MEYSKWEVSCESSRLRVLWYFDFSPLNWKVGVQSFKREIYCESSRAVYLECEVLSGMFQAGGSGESL